MPSKDLISHALKPKWLLALLGVLVVVTVFVFLSYWQLSRANDTAEVITGDKDDLVPLSQVQPAQSLITDEAAARLVSVEATLVDEPLLVLSREVAGNPQHWLVGRFQVSLESGSAELPVVLGWVSDLEQAKKYTDSANSLLASELAESIGVQKSYQGRFFPAEPAAQSLLSEPGVLSSLSPGVLINQWDNLLDQRFNGYLILQPGLSPFETVISLAPEPEVQLNILNLFYAFEWIFFAVFAVYIWYRMVRDEWLDLQEPAASESEPAELEKEEIKQ